MAAPKYPQTPRLTRAVVSAANANRDGTGTIATSMAGVAAGSICTQVRITPIAATTENILRFYLHDGTNYTLIDEMKVAAWTPTAVLTVNPMIWVPRGGALLLPSASHTLRISTNNAETYHTLAEGYDY